MSIYLGKSGGGVNKVVDFVERNDIVLGYHTDFKKYHPIIFGYYKNDNLDLILNKYLIYFRIITAFTTFVGGNINKTTRRNYVKYNTLYVYPNTHNNSVYIEYRWVEEGGVVTEHYIKITINSASNLILSINKIGFERRYGNSENDFDYHLLYKVDTGYDDEGYFNTYKKDLSLSEPYNSGMSSANLYTVYIYIYYQNFIITS